MLIFQALYLRFLLLHQNSGVNVNTLEVLKGRKFKNKRTRLSRNSATGFQCKWFSCLWKVFTLWWIVQRNKDTVSREGCCGSVRFTGTDQILDPKFRLLFSTITFNSSPNFSFYCFMKVRFVLAFSLSPAPRSRPTSPEPDRIHRRGWPQHSRAWLRSAWHDAVHCGERRSCHELSPGGLERGKILLLK